MDEGIKISCFDSACNPDSRQIFINQAGTNAVGQALLDAVLDIAGGEGQFAILSATSQAANQNAWIDAMKTIMEADEKYSKLELVEVCFLYTSNRQIKTDIGCAAVLDQRIHCRKEGGSRNCMMFGKSRTGRRRSQI